MRITLSFWILCIGGSCFCGVFLLPSQIRVQPIMKVSMAIGRSKMALNRFRFLGLFGEVKLAPWLFLLFMSSLKLSFVDLVY